MIWDDIWDILWFTLFLFTLPLAGAFVVFSLAAIIRSIRALWE